MTISGSSRAQRHQPPQTRSFAPDHRTNARRALARGRSSSSAPISVDERRRFVVCQTIDGEAGPDFRSLAPGFASFEQALAACPTIAHARGIDLDEIVVLEIHEFWDAF